jgi:hypothetical protein
VVPDVLGDGLLVGEAAAINVDSALDDIVGNEKERFEPDTKIGVAGRHPARGPAHAGSRPALIGLLPIHRPQEKIGDTVDFHVAATRSNVRCSLTLSVDLASVGEDVVAGRLAVVHRFRVPLSCRHVRVIVISPQQFAARWAIDFFRHVIAS